MKLKQPEEANKYMKMHQEVPAETRKPKLQEYDHKKRYDVDLKSTRSSLTFLSKSLYELYLAGTSLYNKNKKPDMPQQFFNNVCGIYREILTIAPENADLHREFAKVYAAAKTNFDEAQEHAKKAVALEGSAENYFILGIVYSRNSDRKKALSAFKRALERDPENRIIKQAHDSIEGNNLK